MKRFAHLSRRIYILAAIAVTFLGVGFFYFSFVSAQPLNEQKRSQASQTALPTAEFRAEPSYLVKKGGEVNLFTMFQGYAGETNEADQVLYNWCIDGRPIHSLVAGSDDEFVQSGNGYTIQNEYGVMTGGQGTCSISSIYNQEDIVRWYDGLAGGQEAINEMFNNVYQSASNDAILEYQYDEFLRRAADIGDEVVNRVIAEQQASGNFTLQQKAQLVNDISLRSGFDQNLLGYFFLKSRFSHVALKEEFRDSIYVTRTPSADDDIDGDGMSDAWEIKHFGKYAGRKNVPVKSPEQPRENSFSGLIPGYVQDFFPDVLKEVLGLNTTPGTIDIAAINPEPRNSSGEIIDNPTKEQIFGDFLRSIKPEHDFDGDGFFMGENYGNCAADFYPQEPDTFLLKKMLAGETCWSRREAVLNSGLSAGDFTIAAQLVPGVVFELWQAGVPYGRLSTGTVFEIERGYFPNGFEYIAGTDPVQADTDSDGIPDGYDFAGLKQNSFPLKIQKDDDYRVDVHLYGKTQRGSIIRGFEGRKPAPDNGEYNNTPYRHWRTDLEGQLLKVGGGLELPTRLIYSPYPVTPSNVGCGGNLCADKITVTAATATEDVGESSLFYAWYLDGVLLPADNSELSTNSLAYMRGLQNQSLLGPDRAAQNGQSDVIFPSGYGRSVLSFGLNYGKAIWEAVNQGQQDLLPCSTREVGLDVIDVETNKTSHAEIDIDLGDDVQFNEKLVTNVDPSKDSLLPGFNLNDQSIKEQVFKDAIQPQLKEGIVLENELQVDQALLNQQFKSQNEAQIDPNKGYRRGDIISVKADLVGDPNFVGAGANSGKNNCATGYYDKLLYKWYYDDLYLENESGRGKKTVEVALTNLGAPLRQQTDEGSHYLKLEVVDPDTDAVFARSVKEIRVVAPYIDFDASGGEKVPTVSSEGIDDQAYIYKVQPGAEIEVVARPRYFRPLPDGSDGKGFSYQWLRDGQPIEGASGKLTSALPSDVTLNFTVDDSPQAYDEITLIVTRDDESTDGSSQDIIEEASQVAIFTTNPPTTIPDNLTEEETGVAGFLLGFLPDEYRRTFNNVFIFGGFTLLAIIALLLYQQNQKQVVKK